MKIKVSEAAPIQLNWLVAKCEGARVMRCGAGPSTYFAYTPKRSAYKLWEPTKNWKQGGPIIEREGIDIQQVFCYMEGSFSEPCGWQAIRHTKGGPINPPKQIADTPLIAAMRCYCCAKLGEFVEIPEGLCQQENS